MKKRLPDLRYRFALLKKGEKVDYYMSEKYAKIEAEILSALLSSEVN